MAGGFEEGDRVYSRRFGRGEVLSSTAGGLVVRFEDGGEMTILDPESIRLERIEAAPGPPPSAADQEDENMDRDELRSLLREVLEDLWGPADATLGDRWKGGAVVLRPGRPGTQEKEIPLDTFFQKIVRVRDQLRVLEQKVNSHPSLDNEARVAMQQYITRCYGALTTFNVLFKDAEDRFVGGGA